MTSLVSGSSPWTTADKPRVGPGARPSSRCSGMNSSRPLARVDAGPQLVSWQRKLLRFAYVFRPVRQERFGIQVKSILDELEADARAAAGRPDVEAFEHAYESLVGLHELLLGASLARGDDGTVGSWALLPDIHSFAERGLYLGWADTYRSIFLAAIGTMVGDTRPVRRLCHLVQHLEGDDLNSSPVEVRENVLQLPPLMMYQLGGWWVQRVEEQGIMEHATTHLDPVYEVDGVLHYAVANMPGAVPRTSTFALTNVTLPYARILARDGVRKALASDQGLGLGANVRSPQRYAHTRDGTDASGGRCTR